VKFSNLRNLTVIKPSWIIDSIKNEKLQPENDYILEISKPSTNSWNTLQDSNFISNYFNSSRLHFIGSWKEKIALKKQSSNNSDMKFVAHVDMDCFFASIVMAENPKLRDVPIAISYSKNGHGDIASCNYKAREYGIKAGMWMNSAKKLCPDLQSFPYEFEKYEKIALIVNEIFDSYCSRVKILSIDEAYLDLTEECTTKEECTTLISKIRTEIETRTGCTCSSGISYNMLLARLGTSKSKPNGQMFIDKESSIDFMKNVHLGDLPGVGRKLKYKIQTELNMNFVFQILNITKNQLQNICGKKIGENLYNYARGIDTRKLEFDNVRKSVGVDINWGIRFNNNEEILQFLEKLSEEISGRLKAVSVKGKLFTLKVKQGKENEPTKYLGHGDCNDYSKSFNFNQFVDDSVLIGKKVKETFLEMNIVPELLRGVSIHVNKLNNEKITSNGITQYLKQSKSGFEIKDNRRPITECPIAKKTKIETSSSEEEEPEEKLKPNQPYIKLFKNENETMFQTIEGFFDSSKELKKQKILFFFEVLLQYILELIEEMFHLEHVEKILKFVERKLLNEEEENWILIFEKFKTIIQSKITQRYI
jgi:nucleotidyltransferase/DNA polymerase involved in DNA repair